MYQNHPAVPGIDTLPTMYDLPSEDPEEMGLPDEFHDFQPKLLRETCQPAEVDFFIGAGAYFGVDGQWLRWDDRSGSWIGTDREQLIQAQQRADIATQRADEASQRANRERERADLLAAKLQELGIDVE